MTAELQKLFGHLLGPLGLERAPGSVEEAVASYREVRNRAEQRFGTAVPRDVEGSVAPALEA